ncbi:MAG: (Fe-S)-binding protein [Alphaproteobacteria bacterium]|nr:(Fe-S)-binding protein [Alphaproteobacteria bacterium]MCY4320582.1 (Fe-S)-binding protein [Alphaproteobacteria bacterium]
MRPEPNNTPRTVALFATCLADLLRPSVAFAAVRLLEAAGCRVEVPAAQTCCGQPAYNSGDRKRAVRIAQRTVRAFRGYEWIVAPSGSCAGMLRRHYAELLGGDDEGFGERVWELTAFLVDICDFEDVQARWPMTATYHDSCAGLRELGVKHQPRALLAKVEGLTLVELPDAEVCCGFGGAFCIKYPDISTAMVRDKTAAVTGTGAGALLAGDLGCLMNMAGCLSREGRRIEVRHVAEVLAGMTEEIPPL